MIPRYTPEELGRIWSDDYKFSLWLQVELAVCEAMEYEGTVPNGTTQSIRMRNLRVSAVRVKQLEVQTRHDVIAFLTHLEELIGDDARYLHRGLTSSDVVDTAFALQLRDATIAVIQRCELLRAALSTQARRYAFAPMMGRSHGMSAEPITFGLALSGHYAELTRCQTRLQNALETISHGKISGAVGTYAHTTPRVETLALTQLGLSSEWVSTQVIPRDRHADLFCALASTASGLERLATNMRHWQRSEVNEVSEPFGSGQKGSSAMPHKRNPIASENICGLARIVRAYVAPAFENVSLWHERDISHSSAERMMAPDATTTVAYMLDKMKTVVDGFEVRTQQMQQNIDRSGEIYASEAILLEMVNQGMMRQEAYAIVQRSALLALNGHGSFRENLKMDTKVLVADKRIDELCSLQQALKWVPEIIEQALGRKP